MILLNLVFYLYFHFSVFLLFYNSKIFSQNIAWHIVDSDFDKPQAFHKSDTPRSGGLACVISFFIFVMLNNLLFSTFYLDYLVLGSGLFLIGFLDDIKLRLSPKLRLVLMTTFLLISVKAFSIKLWNRFIFLNQILSIKIIYFLFIILCFLFIINGSNLIDGFNGLLAFQLIIINSILLFININNEFLKISQF